MSAVEPRTWTSPGGEVWVQPGHRPDVPYEGYDGLSNYVAPFPPGTRIKIERGTSLHVGDVAHVEGYAPDVVELEGENRGVSLRRALITVLRPACFGAPKYPDWPGCAGGVHHPLCPERAGAAVPSVPYVPSEGTACIVRMWPSTAHTVKTVPPYFGHVYGFDKMFDVRRDDRGFEVGDLLVLAEWDGGWTGRDIALVITYILPGGRFGILPGRVVLGLRVPTPADYRCDGPR